MMNRGNFLVSINTFPIYSPINPILNNCIPPNRYIGNTDDAQPGTVLDSKKLNYNTQMDKITVTTNISKPRIAINLNGNGVKDVRPFSARERIFLKGYFDSPASLSLRS